MSYFKILFALLLLSFPCISKSESIEEIRKQIEGVCTIDENGDVCYQRIIEAPGMSKDEIYGAVQSYFTYAYRADARALIEMQDKEKGVLLAKGNYLVRGQPNQYDSNFHAMHVLKAECKDNKVRVTITLTKYTIPSSVIFGSMDNVSETCPISQNFNNKKWYANTFFIAHKQVLEAFVQIENSLKKKVENSNW